MGGVGGHGHRYRWGKFAHSSRPDLSAEARAEAEQGYQEILAEKRAEGALQWWMMSYMYLMEDGWHCDGVGTGPCWLWSGRFPRRAG